MVEDSTIFFSSLGILLALLSVYYARRSYIHNKKKIIAEKKESRYHLLNESVFSFVCYNLMTKTDFEDRLPFVRIGVDLNSLPHIDEGLIHLNKDIKNFSKRFSKLQQDVDNYNNDFEEFHKQQLPKIVTKFLLDNHHSISENTLPHEPNTIIISTLMSFLIPFWYSNTKYEIKRSDNTLVSYIPPGIATIATVDSAKEQEIIQSIDQLKIHSFINVQIDYHRGRVNKILKECEELSNEIYKNIIEKIEKNDYKTKCKFCKKIK